MKHISEKYNDWSLFGTTIEYPAQKVYLLVTHRVKDRVRRVNKQIGRHGKQACQLLFVTQRRTVA